MQQQQKYDFCGQGRYFWNLVKYGCDQPRVAFKTSTFACRHHDFARLLLLVEIRSHESKLH